MGLSARSLFNASSLVQKDLLQKGSKNEDCGEGTDLDPLLQANDLEQRCCKAESKSGQDTVRDDQSGGVQPAMCPKGKQSPSDMNHDDRCGQQFNDRSTVENAFSDVRGPVVTASACC